MAVALPLILGLATYVGIHFLEPRLAITWSYAHLHRYTLLPWLGIGLLATLPILVSFAWQWPAGERPVTRWPTGRIVAAFVLLWLALWALGTAFPAPTFSIDVVYFTNAVKSGTGQNARWYLLLWFFEGLANLVRPALSWLGVIRGTNAAFSAVALLALAGAARRLGQSRREAAAITLLGWSAFGILQLVMGYTDIYPFPLAVTAVYCWLALGVIAGEVHPLWPSLVAVLAPFWYVGLVLLAPSLLVVVVEAGRGAHGSLRLAVAAVVALAAAGLATVPGFGRPFAWGAFLARAAADSEAELGLSPTSSLLPPDFMLSTRHAGEVAHTVLLVDGIGWLLLLVPGAALLLHSAGRTRDGKAACLGLLVVPYFAYVIAMDPIFGSYADWDLFSYGAVVTSLLGGYAFVSWGRRCPRAFAPLLGLALAAAGVHLLARLNALDVGMQQHLLESPYHLVAPSAG